MADLSSNTWQENDAGNVNPSPLGYPVGMKANSMRGLTHAIMGASKRAWNRSNAITVSTGTATAYRINYEVPPTALVKGEVFRWFAHVANTGPATLRINEVQTAPLVHNDDGAALQAGALPTGCVVTVVFDGTSFRAIGLDRQDPRVAALETANTALRGEFVAFSTSTLKADLSNFRTATKGTVSSGTVTFNYADGTHQTVEVAGNVQFQHANIPPIGGVMQINLTYRSGSIAMPNVMWSMGGGEYASTLEQTGIQWQSGARYRIMLEYVNGVVLGVVG